jgi:hypothetical protein
MLYQLFGESLSFSDGHNGIIEYLHALADKVLHALSDVGFLEELGAVVFRSDQFVELLDLVAKLDGQRIGLKLAGITDGLHMRASWHLAMVQALVRLAKQSIWPSLGGCLRINACSTSPPGRAYGLCV